MKASYLLLWTSFFLSATLFLEGSVLIFFFFKGKEVIFLQAKTLNHSKVRSFHPRCSSFSIMPSSSTLQFWFQDTFFKNFILGYGKIFEIFSSNQIQLHKRFGPRLHCAIRMPTGLLLRVQFSPKKWRNVSIKFRLSLTDGAKSAFSDTFWRECL